MVLAHHPGDRCALVQPDVDEIDIRDWKAFDRAVEIGYRADRWKRWTGFPHPVVDLRRRTSLAEAALIAPRALTSAR